jgi:hypothetical protein
MSILVSALIDVVEVGLSSRRCRASLFGWNASWTWRNTYWAAMKPEPPIFAIVSVALSTRLHRKHKWWIVG